MSRKKEFGGRRGHVFSDYVSLKSGYPEQLSRTVNYVFKLFFTVLFHRIMCIILLLCQNSSRCLCDVQWLSFLSCWSNRFGAASS